MAGIEQSNSYTKRTNTNCENRLKAYMRSIGNELEQTKIRPEVLLTLEVLLERWEW